MHVKRQFSKSSIHVQIYNSIKCAFMYERSQRFITAYNTWPSLLKQTVQYFIDRSLILKSKEKFFPSLTEFLNVRSSWLERNCYSTSLMLPNYIQTNKEQSKSYKIEHKQPFKNLEASHF